jgi:hypothetical protein
MLWRVSRLHGVELLSLAFKFRVYQAKAREEDADVADEISRVGFEEGG